MRLLKRPCPSDLMIAASLLIELLVVSLASASASTKPNRSFQASHNTAHNQNHHDHQRQYQQLADRPSLTSVPSNQKRPLDSFDRSSELSLASNINERQDSGGLEVANENEDELNENSNTEHDESVENSQEMPGRNIFMDNHNSQLQAMHDLFERRQLNNHQLQSSQELNPISIGLDPGAGPPFGLPPFPVPNHDNSAAKPPMAGIDNIDQGLGPSLPFGLNPLPHLLGFQSSTFEGPQRGDQSAHSNQHAVMPGAESDGAAGSSQKVWPKIFRFTDGRINLSEFEKQKKIRLSNKNQHNTENHIESAPIIFDGRQLRRKSFLILHGGIYSR